MTLGSRLPRIRCFAFLLPLALAAARALLAEAPRAASAAFDTYAGAVELRLAQQEHAAISSPPGESHLECLHQSPNLAGGARLDHWRGTTFVPGAKAADFEALLRNVSSYPTTFAPEVLSARSQAIAPDHILTTLRVRQHHVLTVVLDATYDVRFAPATPHRGSSVSRSIRIAEIDSPGTAHESVLAPAAEHGFLWRLNTYWSWQERDGGLVLQLETISLSRSVPRGLGWIVNPYVDSIPRESLAFTLTHARDALQRNH